MDVRKGESSAISLLQFHVYIWSICYSRSLAVTSIIWRVLIVIGTQDLMGHFLLSFTQKCFGRKPCVKEYPSKQRNHAVVKPCKGAQRKQNM